MMVTLLEQVLPEGYSLHPEFPLSQQPQRIDIVVIERESVVSGLPSLVGSIVDHLGLHTLVEFKGPTDDLDSGDLLVILAYGFNYARLQGVRRRADIRLMTLSDRLTPGFRELVLEYGGSLTEEEEGVWRIDGLPYILYSIELGPVSKTRGNGLLYAFTRENLRSDRQVPTLALQELDIFRHLVHRVQQFKGRQGIMALKDAELVDTSTVAMLQELLALLPPEKRVQGLSVRERLAGLNPQERHELLQTLIREEVASDQADLGHNDDEMKEPTGNKLH